MSTGENEQSLRAALDFMRKASIFVLILHFYVCCYLAFDGWGLTLPFIEKILLGFGKSGFFDHVLYAKAAAMGLLLLSVLASHGKKDEKLKGTVIAVLLISGMILFWGSVLFFYLSMPLQPLAVFYISLTTLGYLLVLTGAARLSRLIKVRLLKDPFNEINETFPQMEELLENQYSVNLMARYNFRGKIRRSFVNFTSIFRGVLLVGSPGCGKTRWIIEPWIRQILAKQTFSMLCYDFKYPDLTTVVYNNFLKNKDGYKVPPKFYNINFDDLECSHRCNPLDPATMHDITDAQEASRTILLALNRDWIRRQGEFFQESAILFVCSCMWYLRKYKNGKYCTLPHLIEFMKSDYDDLFPILGSEPEVDVSAFVSAYLNRALEQLEGQVASARIAMSRLSSPQLYWVLTGNDFTLDINNPDAPKILCMGNNPLKIQIYGAVLSLYITRLLKLVNQKGKCPCSLVFDEYSTVYSPMDTVIATGRSNLLNIVLAVQSVEMLRRDYGKELADVVLNICGNIIFGQNTGESAKLMSEMLGKIVQERESISINRQDTSVSRNTQLDSAVPASRISNLSSGEFVGIVADSPDQPIKNKSFHSHFLNDESAVKAEHEGYKRPPKVHDATNLDIQNNYIQIKNDIYELRVSEIARIRADKELSKLLFLDPDDEPR